MTIIPPGNRFQLTWLLDVTFSVAMACAVLYALRGPAAWLHEKLSWLCYGAFAVSWSRFIWVEDWAFMRHLSEFSAFGVIVLMCAPSRLKWLVAIGAGLLWLWTAQHIIALA